DPLPRRLTPVRVAARPLFELSQRALGGASCPRRQLRRGELGLERRQQAARSGEVLRIERTADRLNRSREPGVLAQRGTEERLEVARGRTVHARQADVPARGNEPKAVLDAVPRDARELRPEADVEAARTVADGERSGEMPELVQEDQEQEADGDDEPGHATASRSSARTRALRSASSRSSRS